MIDRTQLRSCLVVTAAYCAFTLTDGALRMLVLLHFHSMGYTPLELAALFLLYECCGVLTNLVGGWIASRFGLKSTLVTGICLQVVALSALSALSTDWSRLLQVAYVVGVQGLSGVAKDFTKVSAKSAIRLLASLGDTSGLFRWVALLTGSKNTIKGVGFFVGGLLLSVVGFRWALWGMAGGLLIAGLSGVVLLPGGIGRSASTIRLRHLLSKSRAINVLSAVRLLLFGARDIWFVVALPVYLYDVLGWGFVGVGTFMAAWVIGYGVVQAMTPGIAGRKQHAPASGRSAAAWGFALALVPLAICGSLYVDMPAAVSIVVGLGLFGFIFAINSAVHSFLILAYTSDENVTVDVGFYYTANALGRLVGTVLSGVLYQSHGLVACLLAASAMIGGAAALAVLLPNTKLTGIPSD